VNKPADTLRLFFALQPAAGQSAALADRVAPLIARLEAQAVPAANLHATLCFLGAMPSHDLEKLRCVAAAQHARQAPLHFGTLEFWREPRVLCATTGANRVPASLRELAGNLARGAEGAGFKPDGKPFRPHLTLARKIHAARVEQCGQWPQDFSPPLLMRCDRFVLMESRRGESGSTYSVVDSWPLYADDTDSSPANIQ
jgi:2'-5' RNA ligase